MLREFQYDDYKLFSSVFSNEKIMEYAYMDCITDENKMKEYFNKVLNNCDTMENKNSYEFAVFTSTDEVFIGFADIEIKYHGAKVKSGEIGYFLLPDYWGKGYATEIAKRLIELCFNELKMPKVVASCNSNNFSSENVMKKVGMVKEGEFRKERYKNGKWDNELRYGILIEEWNKVSELCTTLMSSNTYM
ncbi:MAG: GNAT family protein [Bacteroidota bacterium]|nr:GNAT family protein [Bacteroidota bacterium]